MSSYTHVKTAQVATDLPTSCSKVVVKDVFALLVPSCCNKSGTSCHRLVTSWMTATGLLQKFFQQDIQAVRHKLLRTCCHRFVNVLRGDAISEILEQLVASLLTSSTLLLDDNNLSQTCQQLGDFYSCM
jgi:hypothetical protein